LIENGLDWLLDHYLIYSLSQNSFKRLRSGHPTPFGYLDPKIFRWPDVVEIPQSFHRLQK
jgi:hypothetical protein